MAKAEPRHNNNELQIAESGTDEIEKSLELLDKVLSEFEEEQENFPPGNEPESPSQGHQSEDDGYMSMNGRRTKFVPDFQPTDEVSPALPSQFVVAPNETFSPPTPEEAERIISNLMPSVSPSATQGELNILSTLPCIEFKFNNNNNSVTSNLSSGINYTNEIESEAISALNSLVSTTVPLQTTLPKTRPTTLVPSRYASLPSSNTPRGFENDQSGGIAYIGRKFIGIGINDVHNAVLKRGARMPETIINEHPVTIYPGPFNQKRVPPRTLPSSIERHREVCRKKNSSDLSPQEMNSPVQELNSPTLQSSNGFILHKNDFIKRPISPTSPLSQASQTNSITPFEIKISIQTMDNLMNNRRVKISEQKMNMKNSKRNSQLCRNGDDDIDNFSDDSLEETSLPPPAPPPVVPPPPSLSAPVTPSKRHSIAWEVNLDDLCSNTNGTYLKTNEKIHELEKTKSGSQSQSQSSICSSPGHSSASNKISSDWPDPPDVPICSTEDEAASIYSDSDDFIPQASGLTDGRGTYVIRKGKRRQRIDDYVNNGAPLSPINSKLNDEKICDERTNGPLHEQSNVPSPVYPPSMMTPKSRHSIDLGESPRNNIQHPYNQQAVINSPRSRLSLDLSSPTVTNSFAKLNSTPVSVPTPSSSSKSPSVTKISTPTSPHVVNSAPFPSRYTEFKTYSSTFDGLQALESHVNSNTANNTNSIVICNNGNNNRSNVSSLKISSPECPIVRVSSLPTINQQNQTTDSVSTPRRELAPPIEEDEEDSDGNRGAPLRQIENNISALLRGEMQIAQAPSSRSNRPIGFRPGVHKSESAKEMLLSQNYFGPLPDSPHSSPEPDSDEFPPLPPSPSTEDALISHNIGMPSRPRVKTEHSYRKEHRAPAIPPHATSMNSLKTRSMDAGFSKSFRNGSLPMPSPRSPGQTLPSDVSTSSSTRRRQIINGFPKRSAQSPREERRLQTSCSLPETPIFARGCDIARTPHRRAPDPPGSTSMTRASTGTRQNSLNSSSIVGIGCSTLSSTGSRSHHRGFHNTIQANGAMMPISGLPARGWRRHPRASASTEHLDRLQGSMNAWEVASIARKTTTLPPNMAPPKFFNKSPRDALRRVTSLLINRKGNTTTSKERESKKEKSKERDNENVFVQPSSSISQRSSKSCGDNDLPVQPKKKGFFKSFWKKSRHYSLEQN